MAATTRRISSGMMAPMQPDPETRCRRVVEIADQHTARLQRIDERLQIPGRIGRRMHVDDDRPLVLPRQVRRQPECLNAVIKNVHVRGVAGQPGRWTALGLQQLQRGVERVQHLRRRRETETAADAAAEDVRVDIGQVERPASGVAGGGGDAVDAYHREGHAGHAFQALVGGEHHGVDFRLRRDVQRQRAECRDGIDQQAAPGPAHHRAHAGEVVHHAAAGFGIHQADMADVRIARQGRGQQRGVDRFGRGDRQQHGGAAGLARQPGHAFGIRAGAGDQQLAARRNEGANGGFGDEMAAALQRQNRVLRRVAMGNAEQPLAHARIDRVEVAVPGREVMRQCRAHFLACGHRAWRQQQHAMDLMDGGSRRLRMKWPRNPPGPPGVVAMRRCSMAGGAICCAWGLEQRPCCASSSSPEAWMKRAG